MQEETPGKQHNSSNYNGKQASQKKKAFRTSKSLSLSNLSSPHRNYANVESKVKKYIDQHNKKGLIPTKPSKTNLINLNQKPIKCNTVSIPLESLCVIKNTDSNETKLIKKHLAKIDGSENIVQHLAELLTTERLHRSEQSKTLSALQLSYDNLLAEFAQAKNVIDSLRVSNQSVTDSSYLYPSTINPTVSSVTFPIRRALSTSNICDSRLETFSNYKFVKNSFTPIIDPKLNLNVSILPEKETNLSSGYVSQENCLDLKNSYNYLELNNLKQKLKDYILLEKNHAMTDVERKTFWSHTDIKFGELLKDAIDNQSSKDSISQLTEIGAIMESIALKYCKNEPLFQLKYHKQLINEAALQIDVTHLDQSDTPLVEDLVAKHKRDSAETQELTTLRSVNAPLNCKSSENYDSILSSDIFVLKDTDNNKKSQQYFDYSQHLNQKESGNPLKETPIIKKQPLSSTPLPKASHNTFSFSNISSEVESNISSNFTELNPIVTDNFELPSANAVPNVPFVVPEISQNGYPFLSQLEIKRKSSWNEKFYHLSIQDETITECLSQLSKYDTEYGPSESNASMNSLSEQLFKSRFSSIEKNLHLLETQLKSMNKKRKKRARIQPLKPQPGVVCCCQDNVYISNQSQKVMPKYKYSSTYSLNRQNDERLQPLMKRAYSDGKLNRSDMSGRICNKERRKSNASIDELHIGNTVQELLVISKGLKSQTSSMLDLMKLKL